MLSLFLLTGIVLPVSAESMQNSFGFDASVKTTGANNDQSYFPNISLSSSKLKGDEFNGPSDSLDHVTLPANKAKLGKAERKLDNKLLKLANDEFIPSEQSRDKIVEEMKGQKQIVEVPDKANPQGSSVVGINVYVKLKSGFKLSSLEPYLLKINNRDNATRLAAATVDVNRISELASLDAVESVSTIMPPIIRAGSVQSEGDAVLKADLARSQYALTGSGVKVGVISDGVDNLSYAISKGDLTFVSVLGNSVGGDEGTAMLEIIHDLAPNASLYFHDCGNNILAFNEAITELVNAGCDVIVDDIGWITEPFFEDGAIASHVKTILQSHDVVYASSAGNAAGSHYQGTFCDDGTGQNSNDFSGGTSAYKYLYVEIPAGASVIAVLQWNEDFDNAVSDYDMYLYNNDTSAFLDGSEAYQSQTKEPLEAFKYENQTGSAITAALLITAFDAPVAKELEVYLYSYGGSVYTNNIMAEDSIFGHPAVTGVIACGAVRATTPDSIEPFSSQGPVTMLDETRSKPDVCGVDGVSVTGAGGFYNPFYGTSAAAPHVAAVAALLMERFPTMNANGIRSIIAGNAVDLGAAGFDMAFGYGRADTLAAANSHVNVIFNMAGGSNIGTVAIAKSGKVTKPDDPTRDGYNFLGWYKESSYDTAWNFSSDTVEQDTTIYAKWTPISYTIAYDANGGQGTTNPSDHTYDVSAALSVNGYRKTGYVFAGWSINQTGNAVYQDGQSVVNLSIHAGSVTLFAHWTPVDYTVAYEANGATSGATAKSIHTYDISKELTTNGFNKTGYSFIGWATSSVGDVVYANGQRISNLLSDADAVVTLYAKWNINTYTVSFDTQGGSAVDGKTAVYNTSISVPYEPTREGYTFGGWYKESLCSNRWVFESDRVTGDTNLYAKWNINRSIQVQTNSTRYGTVTGGGLYGSSMPATVTAIPQSGYRFISWAEGANTVSAAAVYTFTVGGSRVLKANFAAIGTSRITVKATGYSTTKITWRSVPYANGYILYRSTSRRSGYVPIATVAGATEYSDSLLTSGQRYYYQLRAYCEAASITTYGKTSFVKYATPSWPSIALKASLSNYHTANLSWTSVAQADGYRILRSKSRRSGFEQVVDVPAPVLSWSDTGLPVGSTYYYKVMPYDMADGEIKTGSFSAVKSVTPKWPSVKLRSGILHYHTASLTWNAVPNAAGYEIERSISGKRTGYVKVGETTAPTVTATDELLLADTTCYYRVRPYVVASAQRLYGTYSGVVSIKPKWPVIRLSAVSQSYTSIQISWPAIFDADGYDLYCSTSSRTGFTLLKSDITATSYLAHGLRTGVAYTFKVKPYDVTSSGNAYGAFSRTAIAKPAWPTMSLTATAIGNRGLKLSWSPQNGASGYTVEQSLSFRGPFTVVNGNITGTEYIMADLEAGRVYYFRIIPFAEDSIGKASGVKAVKVL